MARRLIEGDDSARPGRNEDDNEAPDENEGGSGANRESSRRFVAMRSHLRRAAEERSSNEDRAALPAQAQGNDDEEEEASPLDRLMEMIRTFMSGEGLPEASISREQAQRLLEASAGDLEMACTLYWDDYFATVASRGERRPAEDDGSPRRVRRRLEEPEDNDEEMEEAEEDEDEPDADEAAGPPNVEDPDDEAVGRRVGMESVSVSDDEGPAGRRQSRRSSTRRVRRIQNPPVQHRNEPDNVEPVPPGPPIRSISDGPEQVKAEPVAPNPVKSEPANEVDNSCSDDDCLSDNDWIFDDEGTTPVLPPVAVLWGKQRKVLVTKREDDSDNDEDGVGDNLQNVVAEDHDGDDASSSPIRSGMPRTWVNAGFTMSACGTGLIAKPPSDEEISLFRYRQAGSRNIAPPPHHCRGLTALLSVVTALIYSGASIQGTQVNCNAARKPFSELSETERRREFDSRLADALSALLLVAAQASLERKKRALSKRGLLEPSNVSDEETLRQQTLQRRLRLVPTCRWEDDTGTGDVAITDGQLLQIATSYTSIEDIRSYVLSTMRSFTKKGGCALFLETIIRIHGKGCVERMLRRSRREASLPECTALIDCSCLEKHKKLQQQQRNPARMVSSTVASSSALPTTVVSSSGLETVVLDHSCTSIELISLLLTGNVRSSFHGWSTKGLGIGILSTKQGEIGRPLRRPDKPVWILRGDTSYAVIWLDGGKEESATIAKMDPPETLFRLAHWQCWYGERQKSGMRVITARGKWSPPTLSKTSSSYYNKNRTVGDGIMERRRLEKSPVVSSDEQGEDDVNGEPGITSEEIDRVKVHPDDQNFYPNKYRQWRFDMGKAPDRVNTDQDVKMGPVGGEKEHWTPYFRLSSRQQLIVEMKLSPRINHILWTRWPNATIDKFTPENEDPPEV